MARLVPLVFVLLCSLVVDGSFIHQRMKDDLERMKFDVKRSTEAASKRATDAAQHITEEMSKTVKQGETWLDEQVDAKVDALEVMTCRPNRHGVKNTTRTSLWKCLQMARVVTDGTDIAAKGVGLAADILDTADNFLQGLEACILGGSAHPPSQLAACYLAAIGTIASGIAQNIMEVEQYITIVKRDVEDIHAAIALCRKQSLDQTVRQIRSQHDNCKNQA